MTITLKPGEMLDESTGEIKSAEQIVAEIADAATRAAMPASLYVEPSIDALLDRKKEVLGQLIELDGTDELLSALDVDELAAMICTDWQPGTTTPAHDGEYEIVHPVTGTILRAEYDTLFEVWTCVWQYPTWRGLRERAS